MTHKPSFILFILTRTYQTNRTFFSDLGWVNLAQNSTLQANCFGTFIIEENMEVSLNNYHSIIIEKKTVFYVRHKFISIGFAHYVATVQIVHVGTKSRECAHLTYDIEENYTAENYWVHLKT